MLARLVWVFSFVVSHITCMYVCLCLSVCLSVDHCPPRKLRMEVFISNSSWGGGGEWKRRWLPGACWLASRKWALSELCVQWSLLPQKITWRMTGETIISSGPSVHARVYVHTPVFMWSVPRTHTVLGSKTAEQYCKKNLRPALGGVCQFWGELFYSCLFLS